MKKRIISIIVILFVSGCSSSPSKMVDINASWGRVSDCLARSVVKLYDNRSDASVIAVAAVSDCNSVISREVSYIVSDEFVDRNAIYRTMQSKARETATRYALEIRAR